MIVVDTNIIAHLMISGTRSQQAEQIFRKDPIWVAPLLWQSEFCNVLVLYIRKGLIDLIDAVKLMEEASTIMHEREFQVSSVLVLKLAAPSTCSAYDCEFVALAHDLGVPLITADGQILDSFPQVATSPEAFLAS